MVQQVAPVPVAGVALHGMVHGGQQPVNQSSILLYAAGSGGDQTAATSKLTSPVLTNPDGTFSITLDYTCPSSTTQMYLVAKGGNPGLTPSTVNNANLTMMTALGNCGALNSGTSISVNELTTVAAVVALQPYMGSYSAVASGSGDAVAMANAFKLAGQLVDSATGITPGNVPAGYTVPVAELNTLADVIANCVNSSGGAAGSNTPCGTLFTDTTPSGGTAATDTIGALLLVLNNPNQNVTTIFGLANATEPFQPLMTAAPADWTVPLLPTGAVRILFVGDSFTHGRYLPVRTYNSAGVTDENYNLPSSNARAESTSEPGPYGGMPGIFKELTTEAGLNYDVHIAAISSTSLASAYGYESQVIANPEWNAVVLQELSYKPLPPSLSGTSSSNPNSFCGSVQTIEQGLHAVNPSASVYLYSHWARADEAEALATGGTTYATGLSELFSSLHNVELQAAANDGKVAGVAPVGDAWQAAMTAGYFQSNPYTTTSGIFPWFLYQAGSNPSTSSSAPDYLHPSIYGAYLSALVLFEEITGQNSTLLGSGEAAAAALGISGTVAVELQGIAHAQVTSGSTAYSGNPCSVT